MNQFDTVNSIRFQFITILKNVCKNKAYIIVFWISMICIAGLSMQVQAQTRKAVPYMLPLLHRRREQNHGLQPVNNGIAPSGGPDQFLQNNQNISLLGHWMGNVSSLNNETIENLSVSGNYAFATITGTSNQYPYGTTRDLYVIDVSDSAAPAEVGHYNIGGSTMDNIDGVVADGDYVYMTTYYSGFRVLDVSNPGNPHEVGSTYDGSSVYSSLLSVSGNYAYVVCGDGGNFPDLHVIDVSDPTNPHEVSSIAYGSTSNPTEIRGVYVTKGYAYVTTTEYIGGSNNNIVRVLHIIDVSNPGSPHEVGSYKTSGDRSIQGQDFIYEKVYVSGGFAYVTADNGLHIFNVSDPTNPQEVGTFNNYGVYGVYVSGKYAYMNVDVPYNQSASESALQILDVSDPANPLLVGSYYYDKYNPSWEISSTGKLIYTIEPSHGLLILKNELSDGLSGTIDNVTLDKDNLPTSALSG